MKHLLFNLLFQSLLIGTAAAQRSITPSDTLYITGEVLNPRTYTLAALDAVPKKVIPDQIIYNHRGEIKDTLTGLVGFSLKDLLDSFRFRHIKHKELNELYFVFIATDGYKVVFSWNEIFNTTVGNQCFIITGMDGKSMNELPHRILFISAADHQTGRRYIKGLCRIEVRRAG